MATIFGVAIVISTVTIAAPKPQVAPARQWLGEPYADTIVAQARERGINLVFDLNDIVDYDPTEKVSFNEFRLGLRDFRDEKPFMRVVYSLRGALPGSLVDLGMQLQSGSQLRTPDLLVDRLRAWVRAQADASIEPHELMLQALKITQGHVFLAWETAWNLMCEDWDAAAVRNYGERIAKFVSVTGERHLWAGGARYIVNDHPTQARALINVKWNQHLNTKSLRKLKLVVTKRGDDFSAIYHRIGVELWTMALAHYFDSPLVGRFSGTLGALGEFVHFHQTAGLKGESAKRLDIDLNGAKSGTRIYNVIKSGERTSAQEYLVDNPGKFDDDYQLGERPAAYFASHVESGAWSAVMSHEELRSRFYHATHYDSAVLDPVFLFSTDEYERLHRGLADYIDRGAGDAQLNRWIRYYLEGVRATPNEADVSDDLAFEIRENEGFARELAPRFDFREGEQRLFRQMNRALQVRLTCEDLFSAN